MNRWSRVSWSSPQTAKVSFVIICLLANSVLVGSPRWRIFHKKVDTLKGIPSFHRLRVCLVAVKCFSENTYFPEMLISGKGKCIQAVWLSRKSFYGKSISVFGSSKHFTEIVWFVQTFYGKYFTENQFPCLVRSNILWKIKFVFYEKSIPVFGLWIILRKIWNVLQIQAPALSRQTCNSTKLIIHFNIKNNHPNSSTCIA